MENIEQAASLAIETASDLIDAFGGTTATAGLCGVALQQVSKWRGTDFIPLKHHLKLYRAAKVAGIVVPDALFDRMTEAA